MFRNFFYLFYKNIELYTGILICFGFMIMSIMAVKNKNRRRKNDRLQ